MNRKAVNHRLLIWIATPLLLMVVNLTRDVLKLQSRYEWETVEKRTLRRGVVTPGVMEAVRVAEIKSNVEETVERVMVKEGDRVLQTQPLMELSRSRTKLEFQQRENAHKAIITDYKKSVRELSIQRKLLKSMAVSRQQVEDAELAVEKAKAAVEISEQEYSLAKIKLDSTLVRSPINGVVLKDYTKIGMALSPGKDIMLVGDISKFIVRAKVDELDINSIRVGQRAEIQADAFQGVMMFGNVVSIASQAERETFAKVEVVIEIITADPSMLKHNLSVRVNILIEDIPDTLSVPIRSIAKKDGDTGWVIVRGHSQLVRSRRVKLGVVGGDRIQVLSGLSKGEKVGVEKPSVSML